MPATLVNVSLLTPELIRKGFTPHIAAGTSGHITAFSIRRPIPSPRLRPAATTGGRVGRHQCGCDNEGGSGQADDYRFGQLGPSPLYGSAEPRRLSSLSTRLASAQRQAGTAYGKPRVRYQAEEYIVANDCFLTDEPEITMSHAKRASTTKAQHQSHPTLGTVGLLSLAEHPLQQVGSGYGYAKRSELRNHCV